MKGVIQPAARDDILSICLYFANQGAEEVSHRFLLAIEQTIKRLIRYSEIGIRKDSKNPLLHGLRRWPVKGFEDVQIYYLIQKQRLSILRVLHGKRDTSRMLEIQR